MNLDYFLSSLPLLLEGRPATITADAFRRACESELSGPTLRAVLAMLSDADDPHPFVRAWRDADAQVRNAVAAERARRRGLPPSQAPRLDAAGCDATIAPAVAAAFEQSDPLLRERAIDHLRWTILDRLQGVQPLSETVALAYAAKLKLNARRLSADAPKGAERFEALTHR